MTIQAQLADGRTLEFPDGTDPSIIQATVKKMIGAQQPAQPEQTFGDKAVGVAENIGSLVSGAIAEPVAGIAGIAQSLNPFADEGAGAKAVESTREALTYKPRSDAGQSQQQALGELLAPVGEALSDTEKLLGENTLELTGSPALAAMAHSLPTAALELIGLKGSNAAISGVKRSFKLPKSRNKVLNAMGEAAPEPVLKNFTKKLGDDRFEPHIFGMVKEARKQGFDDPVTTMIANSTKNNKRSMLKQVNLIKKVKGNAREKALQGAADIAGNSLLRNVDFVRGNQKQAGVQLGRVANSLKGKEVNVTDPVNSFFKDMKRLGVEFDESGKPNFEASVFEGVAPAENLVNKISLRMKRNKGFSDTDGFKAHEFKKFIDENVNFEKSEGGLSGRVDRAVKSLRSGINESINNISPSYKQANKQFSDTITVLDELQDVAGRKLDFSGPNADKAAGVLLRNQLNNTGKRANLLTAIGNLEDTAKKYGGNFDDDVLTLSIFADELESLFGSRTRTAIRNEARKGGIDAAIDISQMTIPGALAVGAKAGAKRLRGINEANQLKAIEKLLRSN